MPPLSRWCIRASLAYLVLGLGMGSWMLLQPALDRPAPSHTWVVLHTHVLLLGFLLLMIMGVAFWMFPKVRGARPGREGGWVAFAGINAGVLLRLLAEPQVVDGHHGGVWRFLLGAAAVLPTLGALAFAATIFPRVRAAMTPEEARRARRDSLSFREPPQE
ncbi:MAG: hypothetical protein U0Y82_03275 [Thermoleophilia bacterium]